MTLVFIHGAGCTEAAFHYQRKAFADALFLRLPGRGTAGDTSSIAAFADAVEQRLEAEQVENAILVGSSMGGAIALELAAQRSPALAGCVLIGSGAKMRVAPAMFENFANDFPRAVDTLLPFFFHTANQPHIAMMREQLHEVGQAQTIADFRACDAFDRTVSLETINLPIFALTGSQDRLMPPKYALMLAERIPGAKAQILPDIGHLAMIEAPDQINRALQAFAQDIANDRR